MEMAGQHVIAASKGRVWEALNDPGVLQRCIDGCEKLSEIEPNRYEGTIAAVIGPIKARFSGFVTLSDIVEAERYTISGEGKGGAAGFIRGSACIALADHPEGTAMDYFVNASVGGKLAQLGSRLVDTFAQKHAQTFFARLKSEIEGAPVTTVASAATGAAQLIHVPAPARGNVLARLAIGICTATAVATAAAYLVLR